MAGLAGVFALTGALDPARAEALVRTMARAQAHRAPGGWSAVVHRRMACVAPADTPQTGFRDTDFDGITLALDGTVTNRDRVREGLRTAAAASGEPAVARDDHALVAMGWRAFGPALLDRLDGRFAFALDDGRDGTFHLARDPFNHKPLHYAVDGGLLFFANEVKTLLSVLPTREPDAIALMEWAVYGEVLAPRTLFRGIRSMAPGHRLEVDRDGRVSEEIPYFDPADVIDPALFAAYEKRSRAELMDLVESTVDQAVRRHMDGRSDVVLMLSGGVDSTMVAAFARRHADVQAYTFSIGGNSRLDELPMANRIAKTLGIPITSVPIDGELYRRELAETTYHYEMPLWHMQAVPLHRLARQAGQDGAGLILSGVSIGPFLGAAADRVRWILQRPQSSILPDSAAKVIRKAVYAALGLPVANPFFARTLDLGLKFLDGGAREALIARHERAYGFVKDRRERSIQVMRITDNTLFERRFFHQGDRMCMAHSVEYCDAAVDRDYEALAFNLSSRVMRHKGHWKWILKELATRYVPRDVAFQKKVPLEVPVDEYFSPPFRRPLFENGFLADHFGIGWNEAQSMVANARERGPLLLRLVNMEIWGRLFFMGESVDEVTARLAETTERVGTVARAGAGLRAT